MGNDFQCNPGWSADCVSVNTEITLVLTDFVTDMALLPFTHGMSGPTWINAQGFVGALDFFLSRRVSPEVGSVHVENESFFLSDHYPVRFSLHTLPALAPPGNPPSKARFRLGTGVCTWQQETCTDSCAGLRPLPLAATSESYQHFVSVRTTAAQSVFGPPGTPHTIPGLVCAAARVLHALLKVHRRWWPTAPLFRKAVAIRNTDHTSVGGGGAGTVPGSCPLGPACGGLKAPPSRTTVSSCKNPTRHALSPPMSVADWSPRSFKLRWVSISSAPVIYASFSIVLKKSSLPWYRGGRPSCPLWWFDSDKTLLRKARKSIPVRDLIKYCMIEWLHDTELQWVVEFLQSVSTRVPLRGLVHVDFYALPAKVPHGPIVNARPFLNFTTMWKLVGAHVAHEYVSVLARAGLRPCTQLASHASSSVAVLLRVLHDYLCSRFFRRRCVCLVVDDVRHAYGSVVHDASRCVLRLAGFPEVVELPLSPPRPPYTWVVPMGSRKRLPAYWRVLRRVAQHHPWFFAQWRRCAPFLRFSGCPHVGALVGRSTGWDTWMTPHGALIHSLTFPCLPKTCSA